jgi:hypothetical protein
MLFTGFAFALPGPRFLKARDNPACHLLQRFARVLSLDPTPKFAEPDFNLSISIQHVLNENNLPLVVD